MTEFAQLKEAFAKAQYGVTISRRPDTKFGYRLIPWCEVFNTNEKYLESLKFQLLQFGIVSTVSNKLLRVQGIQNCHSATSLITKQWWVECINMFVIKKHLTKEGFIQILNKLPREHDYKRRIPIDKVKKHITSI